MCPNRIDTNHTEVITGSVDTSKTRKRDGCRGRCNDGGDLGSGSEANCGESKESSRGLEHFFDV